MPTADNPTGPVGPRRKVPTWYYVAGAAVVLGGYYLWSKSKATAAAATAAAPVSSAPAGTAASSYGNAGDLAALAPYLQNMQGAASTPTASTPTAASGSGVAATPVGGFIGSGFLPPQATPGGTQNPGNLTTVDNSGQSYLWINQQQAGNLAPGTTLFYESLPGVFTPTKWGDPALTVGTPLYIAYNSTPQTAAA